MRSILQRSAFISVAVSVVSTAEASDSFDPVDVPARMAAEGWWMKDTAVVCVVEGVPPDPEFPVGAWPSMLTFDDVLGTTTQIDRTVVSIVECPFGAVTRSHIELWRAGQYGILTPAHAIVFGSLWNLEGAGFDIEGSTGAQFYASDALYSFSPQRTLHIQPDGTVENGDGPVCIHEMGWFRPCGSAEVPPAAEEVVDHIRARTADRQGVTLEGFDP